jgi:hypothetical protein
MGLKILAGAAGLVIVIGAVMVIPDIVRYIKISSM